MHGAFGMGVGTWHSIASSDSPHIEIVSGYWVGPLVYDLNWMQMLAAAVLVPFFVHFHHLLPHYLLWRYMM